MKNFLGKLCCLFLIFGFSQMTSAQQLGRAGGGSGFFNTTPSGGQLGHSQAGSFGNFVFNSRWISIGQPNVPSGQEFYGMRIQDRQYAGIFSLNAVNGNNANKDLEIQYGRVPVLSPVDPPPPNYTPSLNFERIINATTTALVMKLDPNGNVGINMTPSVFFKLDVTGRTRCTQGVWVTSDRRYKENIKTLQNASERLANIEGVTYDYKNEVINGIDFTQGRNEQAEYGFIAQDLAKEFPELVLEDEGGYHSVRYEGLIPVLVESIKEQNETNAQQNETIVEQESTIDALNSKVDRLENQMQQMIAAFNEFENTASLKLTPQFSKETIGTLEQNRPNPFKGMTTIAYELPANTNNAQLVVVNLEGKQIANYTVSDRQGNIEFDGSNLAAGTYFYSLVVNGENMAQQKMVIQ